MINITFNIDMWELHLGSQSVSQHEVMTKPQTLIDVMGTPFSQSVIQH